VEWNNKDLNHYLDEHCDPQPEHLAKIERDTYLNTVLPRMLSGNIQGRFLSLLSKMIKPKRVLEIGTFTGYSALCLAEGLAEGGKVISIENNLELKSRLEKNLSLSPLGKKVEVLWANAMDAIKKMEPGIDLIFIDADKVYYPNYFKICLPILRKGGLMIADNVLWSGKVFDTDEKDEATLALRQFNKLVTGEKSMQKIILPLRDGLFLGLKL
jgi:predicted O-methyltransferase YrrM